MLGKQWLNRYLRHSGGSSVERSGDRQHKLNGLEKWSFRLFIEALPIMLQIALLLLMCGLSRYMWSINAFVACTVISFTTLGTLFYIGIVIAGTYSYECPFQTPVSIGLRHLKDSTTIQMLLTTISSLKVVTWVSSITSGICGTATTAGHQTIILLLQIDWAFGNAKLRLVQGIYGLLPTTVVAWMSCTMTGIHSIATTVGHQTIILLLQIDQAFGNAKLRLIQGVHRSRPARLLPTTTEDVDDQPLAPKNSPGLKLGVRNLAALQRQNVDNAHCVSWVLQNITDPEAIDSAIRLAGTIRWFDGDLNCDPPFTVIVSTFEACFDSTGQLYPGLRERAYFSARAILQINIRERAQSSDHTSKYPIPAIPTSSSQHTNPDLHHIIIILEFNLHSSHPHRPIFSLPWVGVNTLTHSLWVSNQLVEFTHVGSDPGLCPYTSYISAAKADHHAVIANILLAWYMLLGGQVEREILWVVDKSYVVIFLPFLRTY